MTGSGPSALPVPFAAPDRTRPAAPVPLAEAPGVFRFFQLVRENPVQVFAEGAYRAPDIYRRTWLRDVLLATAPATVQRVLLDNAANYAKSDQQQARLKPALGEGLLTAEGEHWRRQRRVTAPAFQHRRLLAFGSGMTAAVDSLLARWDARPDGARIDLADEMMHLTYDIISRTIFAGSAAVDAGRMGEAIALYFETIGRLDIVSFLRLPSWVPSPEKARGRPALAFFQQEVGRIVDARLARGREETGASDLLSMLVEAKDAETGSRFTRQEIIDNVITFIGAGHETTANAMAWTFYLLSTFPWAEAKVRAEIDAVLGPRAPTVDDVPALVWTRAVIEEAMRLYPPAPMMGRTAQAADTLGGQAIRPGASVLVSPWLIHRHHALWEEPELFDPNRFMPGTRERIHRFAYLPFGGGPRICIGMAFALQEAVLILAGIIRRYRLHLVPGTLVVPQARITLRPAGGLPMTLHRRAPADYRSAAAA